MASKKAEAAAVAKVTAALAKHGFPSSGGPGLAFDEAGDTLFRRGYPHMRFLSDEAVSDEAAAKLAEDALDAIDPVFRITVPRAVAHRYLLGYRGGTGLYLDDPHRPDNARRRVERSALASSDRPIDVTLLEETLAERGVSMIDTYARWRWPKVLYLYEAFLGTETVARALVRHLVREADDLSRWGFAGQDPHRTNATPHYLAITLPWLFLRLDARVVTELKTELLGARPPTDAPGEPRAYLALLRAIGADEDSAQTPMPFDLALARGDVAILPALVDAGPHNLLWNPGRIAWLLGTARFAAKLSVSGHDLPRMIDHVAPLRDPGIVRLIAAIASQRAGKKAAADWLRRHPSYARPILRDLAALDDPKEKKSAEAALALLDDEMPVAVKTPSPEEVEQEIERIFSALRKKLLAAKDEEAQKELIREAYERYTEAQAAGGDPNPGSYFTHRFSDFECGEWAMLAVDAID